MSVPFAQQRSSLQSPIVGFIMIAKGIGVHTAYG